MMHKFYTLAAVVAIAGNTLAFTDPPEQDKKPADNDPVFAKVMGTDPFYQGLDPNNLKIADLDQSVCKALENDVWKNSFSTVYSGTIKSATEKGSTWLNVGVPGKPFDTDTSQYTLYCQQTDTLTADAIPSLVPKLYCDGGNGAGALHPQFNVQWANGCAWAPLINDQDAKNYKISAACGCKRNGIDQTKGDTIENPVKPPS